MKRVTSLILTIAICIGISVPAYAVESTNEDAERLFEEVTEAQETMDGAVFFEYLSSLPGAVVTNEYESYLQERNGALARERTGDAMPGDEEILAFDYQTYYYDLKEKSEEELAYMGYDPERIEVIKNFQGTEDEILRASADVAGILTCSSKNTSGTRVNMLIRYTFSVSGVFAVKMRDSILIGNTNDFVFDPSFSSPICELTYRGGNIDHTTLRRADVYVAKGQSGQVATAPFEYTVYEKIGPDPSYPHYIEKGAMYVLFQNYDKKQQAYFSAEYKHLTTSFSLGELATTAISILTKNYAGGLQSITKFILSIQTTAQSYGYDELFVHL